MKRITDLQRSARAQRGATLLVAMIFLVVLTLIVVSSMRTTNINTRVVGNMQMQKEAEAAAQMAIEDAISGDFTKAPKTNTVDVDVNNSGQAGSSYKVAVTPTCIAKQPIKTVDLDVESEGDQSCFATGSAQNTGIAGASPSGNSLCTNAMWNLEGVATPPNSSHPAAAINQGVAQRVDPGANC
ncbi:PilX N-terminal domain-containing pilus assembly protein [Diaphorobacter sp.]|uniref:pilus assembly PilX family protein n=1 Tax=Diaphorobacter sp. TaxID=1934310 RepID=UPI0025868D5C|nr:PilX N-terminal domain-containing pilus assembly protein [Diaphorobacter sp.]